MAVITLVTYRGRNDDGNETTATWKAAQNVTWIQAKDANFRIRFEHQNDTGAVNNLDIQLQYNHNGAGWNNVTGASTVVRSTASANLADAANLTDQLTNGTGTFIGATGFDEVNGICGGTAMDVVSNGHFETEFCIQVRSADVTDGDEVELRTINSDTGLVWGAYNVVAKLFVTFQLASGVASAEGVGTPSSVGASIAEAVSTAAGIGAATATGESIATAVGSAAGVGTPSGISPALEAVPHKGLWRFTFLASQPIIWRFDPIAQAEATEAVGSAAGTATVSAVGSSIAEAVVSASGTGAATGIGASTAEAVASASGTGAASGVGASTAEAVGSASGTGVASGVGASIAEAVASSSGTGTATADATSEGSGTASASGVGAAAAVGASIAEAVASANGTGTASGIGAVIVEAAASASGVGTADATSLNVAAAIGSAEGTSTVNAVGASIAEAVGSAAGTSTTTGSGPAIEQEGIATAAGTSTANAVAVNIGDVNVITIAAGTITAGQSGLRNVTGVQPDTETEQGQSEIINLQWAA